MRRKPPKTAFKKGQSGNPNGRPAGKGFVQWRKIFLGEMIETAQPKWKELLEKQFDEALSGNQHAVRLIYENLLPKHTPLTNDEEDNLLDNLTDEETSKMYDFLLTIMEKENVAKFIENATKITNFVKEMKAKRVYSV